MFKWNSERCVRLRGVQRVGIILRWLTFAPSPHVRTPPESPGWAAAVATSPRSLARARSNGKYPRSLGLPCVSFSRKRWRWRGPGSEPLARQPDSSFCGGVCPRSQPATSRSSLRAFAIRAGLRQVASCPHVPSQSIHCAVRPAASAWCWLPCLTVG